ncbi:1-(5-phosphoribosyl)-5-[(5-phosphoribosylamino)methylideneamino]imidazole-4-carboxamide isomerase [Salisediminibacterium halotolerans]|uniref:1-(5-phosphoribosyl)-5-[(5-phosphoribosylamino)methylideneamino] imidazole-4-carboxamide isomerase n=1 Tax=Salisediminibacterium halotolerans TaxID=517425 RepID=A0A1H9W120_9BACI|nr:1-(5-phosphoribosyl)-5-[(5-phosphoribosylamino)methylideneamino]imidazole-4-carboxamide isomerase [Salisediminibacterium haloalkalitolerans]SES27514.1 phosphoribosylformimino-5-aminoimidazole carboxamide ribotide isomerase [Salisediminibacterium haloalkalitolerans]
MTDFHIYPAVDIRDGKCVRLIQGDYDRETIYGDSPYDMAARFAAKGAKWIHIVDLDGAKAGKPVNVTPIVEAARNLEAKIEVGGGIRTEQDVHTYMEAGVDRVILGSSAISDPVFVKNMLAEYGGDRVAIGIDARDGYVATHGWLETSEVKAEELAKELASVGAETFIMTDISRDGMMEGANVGAIAWLAKVTGKKVIASGGVSSMDDLRQLRQRCGEGIVGAIVGKAIYTNKIDVAEAVQEVDGPC